MTGDSIDRMLAEWARTEPDLDADPLAVIGRILVCAEHAQRAVVAALRPHGLTYGDFDVLNTLRRRADPGGTSPGDLARSALITSGAMTTRLDRLTEAGLIERRPDPEDRRAILVRLTRRGSGLVRRALRSVLAADKEFLAPLTRRQHDAVADGLRTLLIRHEPG